MNKTVVAIFFSIMFTSFAVVPHIAALVDDNYDISFLIDSNEEEEKKGEEKVKDVELQEFSVSEYNFVANAIVKSLSDYSKDYSSLFKELASPPPELYI